MNKNVLSNIIYNNFKPLFEVINQQESEIALELLQNGIYPCRMYNLDYSKYLKINKDDRIEMIFEIIEYSINNKKEEISKYFNNKNILECVELFSTEKPNNYRLCILSIIQIYNYICNSKFEGFSGEETENINSKLNEIICKIPFQTIKAEKKNDRLKRKKEYFEEIKNYGTLWLDYYVFLPFAIKKEENKLLCSNRDNYNEYSYCRNAIIHGYSNNFGTKENCLRYFSLLLNLYEVSKVYDIFEKMKG